MKKILRIFRNESKEEVSQKGDRPKEVSEILGEQIEAGLKEFDRSNVGLFMSSFAGGLEIGFSVLLMGTIYTLFGSQMAPETLKMALALCYPLGFIFVIIGRSELFTEHTALAVIPLLNGSVNLKQLFGLWGLVYFGNLIGGFLFSVILINVGPDVGFIKQEAFYHLAHELVSYDWSTILMSSLFAGWMMGLLGWLVTSSQETISRIFVVILVTAVIGLAGLHHCIVGSIEVFSGMLSSSEISLADYFKFQIWATLGNALGGVIFVAVLKYSHIRYQ